MKIVAGLICVLLTASILPAGELIQTMTFSPSDLSIGQEKGYAVLHYGLYPNYDDAVGSPALPELPLYVVIPPSATVTGVEVLSADVHTLQGDYAVMPAQLTRPFSVLTEPKFVTPNMAIYGAKAVWPENIVAYHSTGTKGGFQIGAFRIYPVRYLPADNKLVFCTNLKLRITYQEGAVTPMRRTEAQIRMHTSDLLSLVNNPEDIDRFTPMVRREPISSPFLPAGNYEHVILTPYAYKDTFQVLANWRTKQGIPSRIFCIESTAVYPGLDVAEKMRNFLRDADTVWGLNFAFIGRTDCHLATGTNRQYRNCWAYFNGYPADTLPCDMYYSDLHRRGNLGATYTWNGNRNARFGEGADTIDYWSDIYVGMITLDDIGQARNWMRKILRHESAADTNYFAKIILLNAVSFSNNYMDSIHNVMTTPPWRSVKMYYSGGQVVPSAASWRDSVNSGWGYTAIIAHGDVNLIGIPDYYTATHVSQQTNTNKLNTVIAVCCFPGAIDMADDCLAETMAVANAGFANVMFNSRYGWVNVAEYYNTLFFYKMFPRKAGTRCSSQVFVGQALARVKDELIYKYPRPGSSPGDSSRWRWESYEKNLFGDPANMLPNTSPVRTMGVTHPSTIRTGTQNFTVSVNVTFAPVESVLVCLWKGTEVYARGYTNAAGSVTMSINPATVGQMSVTCSHRNHRRYEANVSVTTGVAEEISPPVPHYFALGRGEPNPFGRITTIKYQVPNTVKSRLTIYDASGRVTRTLVDRTDDAGWYTANWDGRSDAGLECAAGIYFYRLEAGKYTSTNSLVLVR